MATRMVWKEKKQGGYSFEEEERKQVSLVLHTEMLKCSPGWFSFSHQLQGENKSELFIARVAKASEQGEKPVNRGHLLLNIGICTVSSISMVSSIP